MKAGLVIVSTLILMACHADPGPSATARADAAVLISGGTIYTLDAERPVVGAILVDADGRVIALGETRDDFSRYLCCVEEIDLGGAVAYPGFADSHMHLQGVGERELTLNLEGVTGIADLQQRVAARVALAEPGEWITGRGWIETHWSPQAFPTRRDLDAVAPDHPVVLGRADGHAVVANSMALAAGGVVSGRPAPFGGAILTDAEGVPNGMLTDNAMALVRRMIPTTAAIPASRSLDAGISRSLALGLTSLHVAGSTTEVSAELLRRCRADELPIRIVDAIEVEPTTIDAVLAFVAENRAGCDDRVQIAGLKVSVDGALGSRGAALLEPYADDPSNGYLTWTEADLDRVYAAAAAQGLQVWTHAIGDRANRWVLDRYELALAGDTTRRWRIEHAQHLTEQDIPRFSELGVIPSMQPSHAIGDLHFAPRRLGFARLTTAYAWRSLIDAGSVIPIGSDAPVEVGDPRIEFYAAIARADLTGYHGEGWHAEQAMTREEALRGLTRWSAYSVFQDGAAGCLSPGCGADLTVLGGDIMTLPPEQIPGVPVVMTIVGGEVVYRGAP
jgi:predicted amidohydrolase YtcJ